MKLIDLRPKEGSRRKPKVVGRGRGSGHGKTSCRGNNGQGQRAGASIRPGFEGGQTPLYRRLPKFQTNERPNKRFWTIVNLADLEILSGHKLITPELLLEKGVVNDLSDGLRVLGDGEIKFQATVKAHYFSKSAKEKIEAAGGKCDIIQMAQKPEKKQQKKK